VKSAYEQRIAEFLIAPKVALNRIRWRSRNHPDYMAALIRLKTDGFPKPPGFVVLASHIYFEPPKYSFTLFFGSERVLALDVAPRRLHRLTLRKISINCTHWHIFGSEEELESRSLRHREWLDEFWKRARITYVLPYIAPFHDKVQLKLW
jgi:hypothetical protein